MLNKIRFTKDFLHESKPKHAFRFLTSIFICLLIKSSCMNNNEIVNWTFTILQEIKMVNECTKQTHFSDYMQSKLIYVSL